MLNKQYKRFNIFFVILSFIFIFTAIHSVNAQQTKSIEQKSNLKILIIDNKTGKHLANKNVQIYSDNGTRCIKAPCPTNGKNWNGKTDKRGYIIVPNEIRQASMSLTINGYDGQEINRSARKLDKNSWVIALKTE